MYVDILITITNKCGDSPRSSTPVWKNRVHSSDKTLHARLPDGHRMSKVLERPVERRYEADGCAGTGRRRRRIRVMPVLCPVPIVADSVSAAPGNHTDATVDMMSLRVNFLIKVGQIGVIFVRFPV